MKNMNIPIEWNTAPIGIAVIVGAVLIVAAIFSLLSFSSTIISETASPGRIPVKRIITELAVTLLLIAAAITTVIIAINNSNSQNENNKNTLNAVLKEKYGAELNYNVLLKIGETVENQPTTLTNTTQKLCNITIPENPKNIGLFCDNNTTQEPTLKTWN